MSKLKAVIFDLDGTIADTLPMCMEAFRRAINPHREVAASDNEITATFGPSEEGTIKALAPHAYDKALEAYIQSYCDLHPLYPDMLPGIRQVLEMLKASGIKTAMVTGKARRSALISLQQFGAMEYFNVLETGHPERNNKANCIRQALVDLEVGADEAIYVGDMPSDVVVSREVGIPVASVAWASNAEPEKLQAMRPDYLFHKVDAFHTWLQEQIS